MIRAIICLLASALTALQVFFLYTGVQGLCFNDGCAIVDSMTKVSPLFFNIAGFLYFQALFWLFLAGRNGLEYFHKLARLLLLAGLAAEAVLVFFQHSIATVFCSYCLVVCAIIALLNLCCGLRQLLRGLAIGGAVLAACYSLQFDHPAKGGGASLDSGSMAMVSGKKDGANVYLFFSASCSHCEKVIEEIGSNNTCNVRFNPIEKIDKFVVRDAIMFADYTPKVNRDFLQGISINEVPLLIAKGEEEILLLKGEKHIREYLQKTCQQSSNANLNGISTNMLSGSKYFPERQKSKDESCSLDTDCNTSVGPSSTSQ